MTHQHQQNIKIVSLNVKGLNHPVKRKKILDYIRKQNADIILLQETKIDAALAESWCNSQFTDVAYSAAIGKKNGVITLIARKARTELSSYTADKADGW